MSYETLVHEIEQTQHDLELAVKEIEQLQQKLDKVKEVLGFYASGQHIDSASIGSSYSIRIEDGTKAKDCLKEIEE